MEHTCRIIVVVNAVVFMLLTAVTVRSSDDDCTVYLPPVVVREDKCPAFGKLTNKIGNLSALLEEVVQYIELGCTPQHPVNSCAELALQKPDRPSGNYWILNSTESPVQVFCEMNDVFPSNFNVTKGWVRVANLNMTDPDQQCPENLQLSFMDSVRVCGRSSIDPGCDSVTFTTYGVQYQRVCGRVRGYQYRSPDAFNTGFCRHPCTIDNPYVDGISITHGDRPRKHIWTYTAGLTENNTVFNYILTCPCGGGTPPPNFVGSDYYCESGLNTAPWHHVLYSDDPLWDGENCRGLERTCCDPPGLPWFCKVLPQPTTDDLEFRICADQSQDGSKPDEDTPIELVQLYIQ